MGSATFSEALRSAITRRGMTNAEVAAAVGVHVRTVYCWHAGGKPRPQIVDRLADELNAPELRRLMDRRRCPVCHRSFIVDSRFPRKYCRRQCTQVAYQRRRRGTKNRHREREAGLMRRSIAAFCRSCEPAGICRDAGCPLRSFSPLPVVNRLSTEAGQLSTVVARTRARRGDDDGA